MAETPGIMLFYVFLSENLTLILTLNEKTAQSSRRSVDPWLTG